MDPGSSHPAPGPGWRVASPRPGGAPLWRRSRRRAGRTCRAGRTPAARRGSVFPASPAARARPSRPAAPHLGVRLCGRRGQPHRHGGRSVRRHEEHPARAVSACELRARAPQGAPARPRDLRADSPQHEDGAGRGHPRQPVVRSASQDEISSVPRYGAGSDSPGRPPSRPPVRPAQEPRYPPSSGRACREDGPETEAHLQNRRERHPYRQSRAADRSAGTRAFPGDQEPWSSGEA